ncbi:bi-domain-containing oxidoreductase [Sulfuritalea sp.]|uniref:bi-domain-containing oxidoreductase n=1 Tax=Sulfuritalea sp. TaxID=2480090 RepID=UPI00286D7B6F|nr:bi-domain-containing oxidoreductase [Sulfuritalea sp.]
MKQVLIRHGGVAVEEVPAPVAEAGHVLVRLEYSCISVGTEMSGVRTSNLPLWKRALQRPKDVMQVIDRVRSHGLAETRDLVKAKLEEAHPLGYSAAGVVIEVGAGIDDIAVGDRVACGGSQSAYHAEMVAVARNLVVRVPDGVSSADASTVTLGAIALQGVRRAAPTLGETFVVIGLGILGQLTQQLLHANGVRVIGLDLDRRRLDLALSHGMAAAFHPDDGKVADHVARMTDGYGADGVIITAAAASSDIVATAFHCCRRKGRVVLVGDVGLDLQRGDFYAKELDFFVSTSYGPGRYDRTYEEAGLDYPLAYVRWTENRNMQECLRLMDDGRLRIAPLVEAVHPVERAGDAYQALQTGDARPLALLLSYSGSDERQPLRSVPNPGARSGRADALRLAVLGAGGFARGTLIPIVAAMPEAFSLAGVVTRQGHNAMNVARQFGAGFASTDYRTVLADPAVDAVMIATRHNAHGPMVLEALQAGKHVFVEKPLCLTQAELDAIRGFYEAAGDGAPVLMVGFNRRFSPYAEALARATAGRAAPMIINYRVNAGFIARDHWVQGVEGGGRNLGEACHFYDFFTRLTDARVLRVDVAAIVSGTAHYGPSDNFVATLSFEDGSVATLTYTSLGATGHSKERIDVYADGKVLSVDDYRRFEAVGAQGIRNFETARMEKGHREEIAAFASAIRNGGDWPIPLWQQLQATQVALDVEARLLSG